MMVVRPFWAIESRCKCLSFSADSSSCSKKALPPSPQMPLELHVVAGLVHQFCLFVEGQSDTFCHILVTKPVGSHVNRDQLLQQAASAAMWGTQGNQPMAVKAPLACERVHESSMHGALQVPLLSLAVIGSRSCFSDKSLLTCSIHFREVLLHGLSNYEESSSGEIIHDNSDLQ